MTDLNYFDKKDRQLRDRYYTITVIIICIAVTLIFLVTANSQTWVHHAVEEGYLVPPYSSEKRDLHKVKVICKKLGIDQDQVIKRYDYTKCWTFNGKHYYFHKFKYYIPVKLGDLNKTKKTWFGWKPVINERERGMYKSQIDYE